MKLVKEYFRGYDDSVERVEYFPFFRTSLCFDTLVGHVMFHLCPCVQKYRYDLYLNNMSILPVIEIRCLLLKQFYSSVVSDVPGKYRIVDFVCFCNGLCSRISFSWVLGLDPARLTFCLLKLLST